MDPRPCRRGAEFGRQIHHNWLDALPANWRLIGDPAMFPGWYFGFAIFCLILIPFLPALVRIRIRLFRWLGWQWAVNVLEKHFQRFVAGFRVALFVVALVLFYLGT